MIKTTPKDFFIWTGAMISLYVSVISLAVLLFEYIDRLAGDSAVLGYDPYSGGMRVAIANLLVIFPVYIVITHIINQDIRKNPDKKELKVRKWLVFLTIFVSGATLLIDLIVLINTFLGGEEMTASFLLKVLTILILNGGVFYYYLSDIRGKWERQEKMPSYIGLSVVGLVIISIVSGFFIMGSPYTQRLMRYDSDRIDNLDEIQYAVINYYRTKQSLPNSLDNLKDPLENVYIPTDPETSEDYEYNKINEYTFELCATFSMPSTELPVGASSNDWKKRNIIKNLEKWGHKAERTCFKRKIDPEKYPPYNDVIKSTPLDLID